MIHHIGQPVLQHRHPSYAALTEGDVELWEAAGDARPEPIRRGAIGRERKAETLGVPSYRQIGTVTADAQAGILWLPEALEVWSYAGTGSWLTIQS